jgi:isopentenyl diphosphate isomerase/L-lactate dehydrogenase-like FMN-dependent dehydrogenase
MPRVPIDAAALEARAREVMSPQGFAYVAGGAGSEATMAANRAAFDRYRLTPRVLRNAESRDLSVTLFGRTLSAPILTAPIGVLEMAHPDADLAVARAAASLGVPMIFSNQASVSMERCADAMGGGPRWFQLYWSKSDALVESFVHRAESCGCGAIVLTLDTTMLGWRPRDLDLGLLAVSRGEGNRAVHERPRVSCLAQ